MIVGGLRGPGWRVVEARSDHVKVIRDWISSAVTRHDCAVDPGNVELAVSELFTNAVVHGPAGGRVLVGYWLWSGGARLVVCDGGGSGTPRVRHVTSLAEGGRGLQVVDAITARWGSFRYAGSLVVWCDFGELPRVPAHGTWAWLHRVLAAQAPLSARASRQALPEPGLGERDLAPSAHATMSRMTGGAFCGTGVHAPDVTAAPLSAPAMAGGGRDA